MTPLNKDLEFDVFNYVDNKHYKRNGKVYVRIEKLFTREMLLVLLKTQLPTGTKYNIDHFVFQNVDVCMTSICEMYKSLQKIKKFTEYSTVCLSMLKDTEEEK